MPHSLDTVDVSGLSPGAHLLLPVAWSHLGRHALCSLPSPASRPRKQVLSCLNIIYMPFASTSFTGHSFFQHSHPGIRAGSSVFTAMHIPHANLGVFPIPPHSPRSHFHHPHEALAAATSISAAMLSQKNQPDPSDSEICKDNHAQKTQS